LKRLSSRGTSYVVETRTGGDNIIVEFDELHAILIPSIIKMIEQHLCPDPPDARADKRTKIRIKR
jgi:hypothetical protein